MQRNGLKSMRWNGLFKPASIEESRMMLIAAGLDENAFDALANIALIEDYQGLYHQFCKLTPSMRAEILHPWQLICLSGDTAVLEKAMQQHYLPHSEDCKNENPLHYATASGEPKQIEKVLTLGIPFHATAADGLNALHFAALSHEPAAVDKLLVLEKNLGTLSRTSPNGITPLHVAAWAGDVEVVRKMMSIVDIKAQDDQGYNAMNYAINGGNQPTIKALKNAGLEANPNQDDFSFGALKRYQSIPQCS